MASVSLIYLFQSLYMEKFQDWSRLLVGSWPKAAGRPGGKRVWRGRREKEGHFLFYTGLHACFFHACVPLFPFSAAT